MNSAESRFLTRQASAAKSLKEKDKEELYSSISDQLPTVNSQERVFNSFAKQDRRLIVNLHSGKKMISLTDESGNFSSHGNRALTLLLWIDHFGDVCALSETEASSFLFAENEQRKRFQ